VNLVFAGLAVIGALLLLKHQRARAGTRLDLPGVALVSASMFCLVYGFSNAANHSWHTPPEPRHRGPRAPGTVPDRDVADPRLHHRVLGRGSHPRRRRGDLRHAAALRPAPARSAPQDPLQSPQPGQRPSCSGDRTSRGSPYSRGAITGSAGFLRSVISITLGGAVIATIGAALGAVS
jgi:hypothetical protein